MRRVVARGRAARRRRGRRVGNCSASQARRRSAGDSGSAPLRDAPLLGQQSGQRRAPGQPASASPQGRVDRRPGLVIRAADRPGTPVGPSPGRGAVGVGPSQDPLDVQRRPLPDRRTRRPRSAPARRSRGPGPHAHDLAPQPTRPTDSMALLCRTRRAVANPGRRRQQSGQPPALWLSVTIRVPGRRPLLAHAARDVLGGLLVSRAAHRAVPRPAGSRRAGDQLSGRTGVVGTPDRRQRLPRRVHGRPTGP